MYKKKIKEEEERRLYFMFKEVSLILVCMNQWSKLQLTCGALAYLKLDGQNLILITPHGLRWLTQQPTHQTFNKLN